MSLKKRILKYGLIGLGLFLFVGYFAFSTFFFKPLEGAWEYDVAGLIPRKVDFFVAKANLNRTFSEFPDLAIADEVKATKTWRVLSGSPGFNDFKTKHEVDQLREDIRTNLAQIPLGLDVLDIIGGKELAIAGTFQPGGLANSKWAVYGRANWAGKFGVSLLRYPSWIGLPDQGITVEDVEDAKQLSGGQLQQPLFVSRVRDVIVVGNSQELVAGAPAMARAGGEDSLYLSAGYSDHVDRDDRAPGKPEAEVVLDVRAMLESLAVTGPWPDTTTERFVPAFLGRLLQAPSVKNLAGIVGFPGGVRVDIHGEFSSERITSFQERLYRTEGFDQKTLLRDAARMAPADCVMFAFLHGPVADILKQALASADPALRSNLDDALRSTGRYQGIDDLIQRMGEAMRPRLALIVREHDYGPITETIPSTGEVVQAETGNDNTVFAITVISWLNGRKGESTIDDIRNMVGDNPEKFGLQGYDPTNPSNRGFYSHSSLGFPTLEYWSPFIPGTGVISTMTTDENHFWMTNHEKMFLTVRGTYLKGGSEGYPRLSELPQFRTLLDSGPPSANLIVWFNPRKAAPTLRKMAKEWAEDNVFQNIDYGPLRREEQARVLSERFGGQRLDQLDQAQQDELADQVDLRIEAWRERYRLEQVPAIAAERERTIDYLEAFSAMLFMADLSPREFTLAVRAVTPLDPE